MSTTTTNLNLIVEQDDNTRFSGYHTTTDNNFKAIDAFAGTKGQANGIAGLGADGKVPSSQLPATSITVTNVSPVFVADNTYSSYDYKGTITVAGATASMRPEVVFGLTEALSGDYAPICESGTDSVYIYAKVNTAITIPLVVVYKE